MLAAGDWTKAAIDAITLQMCKAWSDAACAKTCAVTFATDLSEHAGLCHIPVQ